MSAPALNALYANLAEDGRKDGAGGGLSSTFIAYVHRVTRRMLNDALRWDGWRATPPTSPTRPPRTARAWTRGR